MWHVVACLQMPRPFASLPWRWNQQGSQSSVETELCATSWANAELEWKVEVHAKSGVRINCGSCRDDQMANSERAYTCGVAKGILRARRLIESSSIFLDYCTLPRKGEPAPATTSSYHSSGELKIHSTGEKLRHKPSTQRSRWRRAAISNTL